MTGFRILHVCTGNICRSPIAERLTRLGLEERLGAAAARFEVGSAGTWGHEGSPMEWGAVQALAELGIETGGFRARELTAHHVAAADLVLGATRDHRAQVVGMVPAAVYRTFTLREFARTAPVVVTGSDGWPDDPVDRARAIVDAVAFRRGDVPPRVPRDDDVADPYGAPLRAFRACVSLITAALEPTLDVLTGSSWADSGSASRTGA